MNRLKKDKTDDYSEEHACNRSTQQYRPEYSLYVGDLSNNVYDEMLYHSFTNYPSLFSAKVVTDTNGKTKNYGFVRFNEEIDQQKALIEMQHIKIGRRPVRISLAAPKRTEAPGTHNMMQSTKSPGVGQYHWGGYSVNYNSNPKINEYYGYYEPQYDDDLERLEDPHLEVDVEKENHEFMMSSEAFFNAMDQSRWHPLDHVTSQLRPPVK